jgi:hypothetical protein
LVRGRLFERGDRLSEAALTNPAEQARHRPRGVVLVNQALADRFWPGQDPVGRAVRFDHLAVSSSMVVGVVGNVRSAAVASSGPAIFVPWGEIGSHVGAARVRRTGGRARPARRCALDSGLLVSNLRPMDAVINGALSRPRFHLVLVSSFALLA